MALAMGWVSRITTISIMMVVPGVGGYWLDQKLQTKFIFTLIGFALGMTIGMWQLIQATKSMSSNSSSEKNGDSIHDKNG